MFRGAIVGFGPAGVGPLVAAARAGALNKWLKDGLVIFERGSRAGFGKFGQYLITANTTAAYTLDPFRETQSMTPGLRDDLRLDTEDPIMEEIRALPTYKLLDELSQQGPLVKGTLRQYGEFSEEVAQCFLERIAASGTSRWLPNTTVESLQLHDAADVGSPVQISAQTADGAHLSVSARSVLLATGGLPKMPSLSAHLNAKLRSSDYIQREVGMAEVEGILKAQGDVKIAVIGGSHSAFSGSQLLLNMLGDGVSVEILHRDVIRVYYDSVADAEAAGYEVNPASVCAISGQVNRYGGIRPPVRELYQDVLAGTEGRLRFVKCGVGQPTEAKFFDALERADLIVPAFGYTANLPPLKNAGGAIMDWALDPADGQALMNNSTSQLSVKAPQSSSLGERSSQLPNVFGAGLGFGLKAGGELKIGEQGVRIDGQAQYHSWIGVMNLNGMAKSTLPTVLAKPEEALLCAVLTHAWVRKASLWSALLPSMPPTHAYGWESKSPFASPFAAGAGGGAASSQLSDSCDAVFADWDLDGNGELSVRELSVKLQELGVPSAIEQLHALFAQLDTDADGRVTGDDLKRYFAGMDAARMETATAAAFAGIDSDGDGTISLGELQAHVARFGRTFLTPHEGMLMLQAIGREGGGVVGPAEFATLSR